VAIFRSDGTVKFATVINYKIAPDGVSYLYDVQVDQKGSYYEDRYPDSLFKIMYDIETEVRHLASRLLGLLLRCFQLTVPIRAGRCAQGGGDTWVVVSHPASHASFS
jgi:hypothetical protein